MESTLKREAISLLSDVDEIVGGEAPEQIEVWHAYAEAPADIAALAELLVNISRLAIEQSGRLVSLDLNPVMVLPAGQGVRVVDVRAVTKGTA